MRGKPNVNWSRVFDLRCKAKRGVRLSDDEQAYVSAAYEADGERYAAMTFEVFEATAPFGATTRKRER